MKHEASHNEGAEMAELEFVDEQVSEYSVTIVASDLDYEYKIELQLESGRQAVLLFAEQPGGGWISKQGNTVTVRLLARYFDPIYTLLNNSNALSLTSSIVTGFALVGTGG
jgi:hypothetical protein